MGVKLHKNSTIINNITLFVLLSLIFVHIITSIGRGVSAFNFEHLSYFYGYIPELVAAIVTIFFVRRASKVSIAVFTLFFLYVFYECLLVFFLEFDKVILVLNFTYLVFGFYFYGLLKMELAEAVYCPGFKVEDVGPKSFFNFNAKITYPTNEESSWGVITQIGDTSCFVLVEEKKRKTKGKVKLTVEYEGTIFEQYGEITTSYGGGVGIKFLYDTKKNSDTYGWNEFYTIVCHRGLLPQYYEGLT